VTIHMRKLHRHRFQSHIFSIQIPISTLSS